MLTQRYNLWHEGEYNYSASFGFQPNIVSYLHDDENIRPCIIIVPGGGYRLVSPSEGEIVAKKFYEKGYQAFVCTYTINLIGAAPLKLQPLNDLSRAVRYIRSRASKFHVDSDHLVICGFSAGGHLCASLGVHYGDIKDSNQEYGKYSNRPDAIILSYPVITTGKMSHKDSFTALLGENPTVKELEYFSAELWVKEDTPPCFLWQTATDELVPVENSGLMAEALKKKSVPFAYHVFSKGQHGLSLADDVWASGEFGEPYTMEQVFKLVEQVKSGAIPCPEEGKKALLDAFDFSSKSAEELKMTSTPNREVEAWPILADIWMREIMNISM